MTDINLAENRPAVTFFLCQRATAAPIEQWAAAVPPHLKWMSERHADGTILISGPGKRVTGGTGEPLGMYLIRAASFDEAMRIAATDPLTDYGFEIILFEWEVHQILGIGPFSQPAIRSMFGPK